MHKGAVFVKWVEILHAVLNVFKDEPDLKMVIKHHISEKDDRVALFHILMAAETESSV